MYLQQQRYRDDPLRSVKGVREIVVELRVETEYLELREQKDGYIYRQTRTSFRAKKRDREFDVIPY